MDRVRQLLNDVKQRGLAPGKLLGLLNVLIGRRVALADGTPVSAGLTYRELAGHLKRVRWEPDTVSELGLDPKALPPRDRERYWYQAIVLARVDSPQGATAGDEVAVALRAASYDVGPAPGAAGS
ncbi:MAG TPA: hypothetical protein VFW33_02840 [Gemmataceae bacterium]|nr:hypothetical protein [Gemmataceae bacterium]